MATTATTGLRALLAAILILATSVAAAQGAPPPCDARTGGPPSCAQPDWWCLPPATAARTVELPTLLRADCEARVKFVRETGQREIKTVTNLARKELEEAAYREGRCIVAVKGLEAELVTADRGHPTWVLVVSVVGTALVVGATVGGVVYLAR